MEGGTRWLWRVVPGENANSWKRAGCNTVRSASNARATLHCTRMIQMRCSHLALPRDENRRTPAVLRVCRTWDAMNEMLGVDDGEN